MQNKIPDFRVSEVTANLIAPPPPPPPTYTNQYLKYKNSLENEFLTTELPLEVSNYFLARSVWELKMDMLSGSHL